MGSPVTREPSLLVRALRGEKTERAPFWFMRQAGRYLPEYRALRAEVPDFIGFCLDPARAAEVTLQPIRRFGMDGAILFADILLVPYALGLEVSFKEGVGPQLAVVRTRADVERLADRVAIMVNGRLAAVESIETLREDLMLSCQMWVTLGNPHPGLIDAAREAGATEVTLHGNSVVITSRADQRMPILQALEKAHGRVERLTTEELSLEDVYLKYIGS